MEAGAAVEFGDLRVGMVQGEGRAGSNVVHLPLTLVLPRHALSELVLQVLAEEGRAAADVFHCPFGLGRPLQRFSDAGPHKMGDVVVGVADLALTSYAIVFTDATSTTVLTPGPTASVGADPTASAFPANRLITTVFA